MTMTASAAAHGPNWISQALLKPLTSTISPSNSQPVYLASRSQIRNCGAEMGSGAAICARCRGAVVSSMFRRAPLDNLELVVRAEPPASPALPGPSHHGIGKEAAGQAVKI